MNQAESLAEVGQDYNNTMRSRRALEILAAAVHKGETILDVGGGISPFYGATHLLDILPYDRQRLMRNSWGGKRAQSWDEASYTQFDCCEGKWPFEDQSFDVGCNVGMIEDIRDPIFVIREMQRVCRKVLIETPSRLFEQTVGADHQRYAGFWHHRWMVYERDGSLVFQRKTPIIDLPGCHFRLQPWQRFDPEQALFVFFAESPFPVEEVAFWSDSSEFQDLAQFVNGAEPPRPLLIKDWRRIVYHFRQMVSGAM
jgi:SAM-dependent methyltransferase